MLPSLSMLLLSVGEYRQVAGKVEMGRCPREESMKDSVTEEMWTLRREDEDLITKEGG